MTLTERIKRTLFAPSKKTREEVEALHALEQAKSAADATAHEARTLTEALKPYLHQDERDPMTAFFVDAFHAKQMMNIGRGPGR